VKEAELASKKSEIPAGREEEKGVKDGGRESQWTRMEDKKGKKSVRKRGGKERKEGCTRENQKEGM
jgi:hypothetical protein